MDEMGETAQQYSQRIMKAAEGKDPLKTQSATAKKLEGLVRRAPASKLRKRPAPDKWSVVEILAHLADTEIAVGWRIRSILGAPGTPIQAFDQDAWAAAGNYAKRDPRKSIEQFRAVRDAISRFTNHSVLNNGNISGCTPNAAKKASNASYI